ncbi:hypothetical protein ACH9D2_01270 [Kocuria sp. M4R2S49]|uniref:hypothetical protein n=1 Tax=Kocuria rhizosphaericola TaxID=3376284 RepID=UPI00379628A7
MGELLYGDMTPAQAADSLDAFIAERAPALEQLRSTMAAHGLDPDALLKATSESVGPVRKWITSQAGQLSVDHRPLAEDPTRPSWPSWARNARLVDPHTRPQRWPWSTASPLTPPRSSPPLSPACTGSSGST